MPDFIAYCSAAPDHSDGGNSGYGDGHGDSEGDGFGDGEGYGIIGDGGTTLERRHRPELIDLTDLAAAIINQRIAPCGC